MMYSARHSARTTLTQRVPALGVRTTKHFTGDPKLVQRLVDDYFASYPAEGYGTHIVRDVELSNGLRSVTITRYTNCN